MKTKIIFAGLMICSTGLIAQVEHDDMYFKKKDRAKLNERKEKIAQEESAQAIARGEKQLRFDYPINTNQVLPAQPNQTNPEYIARSQSEMVGTEEQDYFVENYQYMPATSFNNFSNSYSAWNSNQLYNTGFFAPQIYGWNSPYYSPYNDPYLMGFSTNPWYNPSFRSGWSVSFNYAWGNNWNYGWGNPYNNFMWGNSWTWGGNPYCYGYGNGFYNTPIIIVDNGNNNAVYGKRSSRAANSANTATNDPQRSTRLASYTRDNNVVTSGGATVKQSTRATQAEYYTPQWRRVTQQSSGTTTSYSAPQQNRMNSSSNSSFNNSSSNSSQRSSYSAPATRSSSSSGSSAPVRSSGGGGSPSRSSRGGN